MEVDWLRPRLALAAVMLALTLAPGGLATWSVSGDHEPNTPDDAFGQRMYANPDVNPAGMRIYFDAVVVDGLTDLNPNVGALQSRILTSGQVSVAAWLGVWKDCNADGYIGHAESAMFEYKQELLLEDSICPPGSRWNYQRWVSEFIHIGPVTPPSSGSFPRALSDYSAAIWGDYGRPQAGGAQYGCTSAALPRGTVESTGAMLRYADCQMGHRVLPTWNALGDPAGMGLSFDDPYHPERDCDNPLNVGLDVSGEDVCHPDNTGLLEGSSGHPMFVVWDCSTNPDTFAPAFYDVDGSAWDGFRSTCVSPGIFTSVGPFQQNWPAGSGGYGSNPTDGKRKSDFTFTFALEHAETVFGIDTGDAGLGGFATGEPAQFGLTGRMSSPWGSVEAYGPPSSLAGTFRGTDLEPAGGTWLTFYAEVGTAPIQRGATLPNSFAGTYGGDACGEYDNGVHNGWDCSPSHWWNPAYGGVSDPDGPRPGWLYDLRDTDCYDGLVAKGTGLYASLAPFSNDPSCPTV